MAEVTAGCRNTNPIARWISDNPACSARSASCSTATSFAAFAGNVGSNRAGRRSARNELVVVGVAPLTEVHRTQRQRADPYAGGAEEAVLRHAASVVHVPIMPGPLVTGVLSRVRSPADRPGERSTPGTGNHHTTAHQPGDNLTP